MEAGNTTFASTFFTFCSAARIRLFGAHGRRESSDKLVCGLLIRARAKLLLLWNPILKDTGCYRMLFGDGTSRLMSMPSQEFHSGWFCESIDSDRMPVV